MLGPFQDIGETVAQQGGEIFGNICVAYMRPGQRRAIGQMVTNEAGK